MKKIVGLILHNHDFDSDSGLEKTAISISIVKIVMAIIRSSIVFLIFISDLDNSLSSRVLKFADDTKSFCSVM